MGGFWCNEKESDNGQKDKQKIGSCKLNENNESFRLPEYIRKILIKSKEVWYDLFIYYLSRLEFR